jgi:choline dehydrogenase-like flavoprotein
MQAQQDLRGGPATEVGDQATGETDDVLVIGAGASGAVASWALARAGFAVTCLEQGGWMDPSAYTSDHDDWEYHRLRDHNPNPNVRRLPHDYPVVDVDTPIKPLLYNAVGGSTVLWSGHFPRFHPDDFRVRSLDGVAEDWPLTYAELAPYYERNDVMMGIAGRSGDPAHPPRSARQMPPVPLGAGGQRLAAGFDALGWHWWPADSAIATRPYRGRSACNSCGPCELGCPTGAKASVDVTHWPEALARGARLITGARVSEITTDAHGRATGAVYLDAEGVARHRRARAVIVAANAIGTSRLLLLSASPAHPEGLANRSGLVGRNLMHHPIATVTGVFDDLLDGYRGVTACSLMSMEFYGTDPDRDFVRGYKLQALRSHGPAVTALGGFGLDVPWGADHHRRHAELFARTASLTVTAEDLPDPGNRVTLDDRVTDAWGIPAPRLTYAVDDNSRRMLEHGIGSATQVMEAAGAREILVTPLLVQGGFHLMGTARMGDDPAHSVVDRWGRAHDCDNLFVVDGSTFVTGAAMNPTSTIQALALRTAEHLAAHGPTRAGARSRVA